MTHRSVPAEASFFPFYICSYRVAVFFFPFFVVVFMICLVVFKKKHWLFSGFTVLSCLHISI